MAKTLEKAPDKIQQICDLLKKETLEPAQLEAEAIIEAAQIQATTILEQAKIQAEELRVRARQEVERERAVFNSALSQAAKQALESLRQVIGKELFNPEMQKIVDSQTTDPKVVANIIQAIIVALEKEGIKADLSAIVPRTVTAKQINDLLGKAILERLKGHSVEVGSIAGGAQVKLHEKQLTLDISDTALKELLAAYVRKDFRNLIFQA